MSLFSSQIVGNVSAVQIETHNKAVSRNETISNLNRQQCVIGLLVCPRIRCNCHREMSLDALSEWKTPMAELTDSISFPAEAIKVKLLGYTLTTL